jgi:hypothetical protein
VGSGAARHARAARHRTVGSPGTVAVYGVWATGRRCTVEALQPPLSSRLTGAWCLLVMRRLRRCAHSPKGDHDGHAQGISVYFNSTPTVGPPRHTWWPRSCPELGPQDTWRPRSCPGLGSGSWVCRTRGSPGAAPGWAAGAGATGHVAASELPRAGQRELGRQDAWRPRSCPGLGCESGGRGTRGSLGAAPGCAVHAEVNHSWGRVICMSHLLS